MMHDFFKPATHLYTLQNFGSRFKLLLIFIISTVFTPCQIYSQTYYDLYELNKLSCGKPIPTILLPFDESCSINTNKDTIIETINEGLKISCHFRRDLPLTINIQFKGKTWSFDSLLSTCDTTIVKYGNVPISLTHAKAGEYDYFNIPFGCISGHTTAPAYQFDPFLIIFYQDKVTIQNLKWGYIDNQMSDEHECLNALACDSNIVLLTYETDEKRINIYSLNKDQVTNYSLKCNSLSLDNNGLFLNHTDYNMLKRKLLKLLKPKLNAKQKNEKTH